MKPPLSYTLAELDALLPEHRESIRILAEAITEYFEKQRKRDNALELRKRQLENLELQRENEARLKRMRERYFTFEL